MSEEIISLLFSILVIPYEMDYLYCAHAFKLAHRKGAKLLAEFHKLLVFIFHVLFSGTTYI